MEPASNPQPAQADLGAVIARVQSRFVRAAPPHEVFALVLADVLSHTNSRHGLIGELGRDEAGRPFVRVWGRRSANASACRCRTAAS